MSESRQPEIPKFRSDLLRSALTFSLGHPRVQRCKYPVFTMQLVWQFALHVFIADPVMHPASDKAATRCGFPQATADGMTPRTGRWRRGRSARSVSTMAQKSPTSSRRAPNAVLPPSYPRAPVTGLRALGVKFSGPSYRRVSPESIHYFSHPNHASYATMKVVLCKG